MRFLDRSAAQMALPGTVDILSHLVRRMNARREAGETVRFCLLGSYREDEVESRPIAPLLADLRKQGRCLEITLQPLTPESVGQLLGSMLGLESPPVATPPSTLAGAS